MPSYDQNPFSTPAPVYFDAGGNLTPAAASVPAASAASSGSSGFWSALGSILAPVAQTAGIIAVSKAIGNTRQPGPEQFQNPLTITPGAAGQPGTTPTGIMTAQLIPGVQNQTAILGLGALVAVGILAVIIARR